MKYAAIDIGSNAVRLLIAEIIEHEGDFTFKKNSLIRVPLRLGDDSFMDGHISERKEEDLLNTMIGFKHLMQVFKIQHYRACATSAMREAGNGEAVAQAIYEKCGVRIEILSGDNEAQTIYANHIEQMLDINKTYLYIDVGGGSTELSLLMKGKVKVARSFDIGSVRMLDNLDREETWVEMRNWVRDNLAGLKPVIGIGTGGNINKLYKMSELKNGEPLSISKLKSLYDYLAGYSLKDRIRILGLNQDRADVIIPASEIYLTVMKWAGIKQMYVPKVGLCDGIINLLIEEHLSHTKVLAS